MTDKKLVALITGANSGIGLELARQLLSKTSPNYHILLATRSPTKGHQALQALLSTNPPGTASLLHLDVTDDASIAAAAAQTATAYPSGLDILVNNAGFASSSSSSPTATAPRTRASMHASFDTNAVGPMLVAQAFAPLLALSTAPLGPRIINISSRAGSIGSRLTNEKSAIYDQDMVEYRVSKAALNMLSVCMQWEYGKLGVRCFCFCPGFTESNLSPLARVGNGARRVEVAVGPIVGVVEGERDGEEGGFLVEGGRAGW